MTAGETFDAKIKMELGEMIFRVVGLQVAIEARDAQIAALTAKLPPEPPPAIVPAAKDSVAAVEQAPTLP